MRKYRNFREDQYYRYTGDSYQVVENELGEK